ncbi:hypothetical protein Tco_0714444 [Tanacetum coccineum]
MGTYAANGSICSSDLMGAGAGTFSSAILSAKGYQQRQENMTCILILDENTDMLRLIMVRISLCLERVLGLMGQSFEILAQTATH